MAWDSVVIAAIAGAMGGVLGVVLAGMIGKLFRLNEKSQIRTGITVAFVIAAANLLPNVLEPYLGEYVRTVIPAPDYFAELEADPFWQRIFRDNPELAPIVKDRIHVAYRQGGKSAVTKALLEIGAEIGSTYLVQYMPKAHEDQIPKLINYYAGTLETFGKQERPLCYYWLFDGSTLSVNEVKQVASIAASGDLFLKLIETAYNEVPSFDPVRGEELQNRSMANIQDKYGDGAMSYLLGTLVPESVEQEAKYCSIYYDMYRFMQDLEPEDQVAQFRYVFQ